jgi:hypothetical protein
MTTPFRTPTLWVAAVVLLAGVVIAAPVEAAVTIDVPCDVGALRQAINTANGSGGGTLVLAAGCTYTVAAPDNTTANGPNGLPVVSTDITLVGNGAVIRRPVEAPAQFRLIEVAPSASLTASRLSITGGHIDGGRGGGVYNGHGARLALTGVTLSGNATPNVNHPFSIGFGGAIFNAGGATVSFQSSTVVDNGNHTQIGGAVANLGGHVEVRGSTFRRNVAGTGGALDSGGLGGTMRVQSSTFEGNRATDAGGAIDNDGGNTLEVSGSVFQRNNSGAGAGIFNGGTVVVSGSTFAGGTGVNGLGVYNGGVATVNDSSFTGGFGITGGGIYNLGDLTVSRSSITGNQVRFGGGLWNESHDDFEAQATLIGTRITGNHADEDGGGVYNTGKLIRQATAIVANTPNDCVNRDGGTGC